MYDIIKRTFLVVLSIILILFTLAISIILFFMEELIHGIKWFSKGARHET